MDEAVFLHLPSVAPPHLTVNHCLFRHGVQCLSRSILPAEPSRWACKPTSRSTVRCATGLAAARVWAIEDCRHLSRRLERDLIAADEQMVRVPPKLMVIARDSTRVAGREAVRGPTHPNCPHSRERHSVCAKISAAMIGAERPPMTRTVRSYRDKGGRVWHGASLVSGCRRDISSRCERCPNRLAFAGPVGDAPVVAHQVNDGDPTPRRVQAVRGEVGRRCGRAVSQAQ